jgi:hypothetical protein
MRNILMGLMMKVENSTSGYRSLNRVSEKFNQKLSVNTPGYNRNTGKTPPLQGYSHRKQSEVLNRMAQCPGDVSQEKQVHHALALLATLSNMSLPAAPSRLVAPNQPTLLRATDLAPRFVVKGSCPQSDAPQYCPAPQAASAVSRSGGSSKSATPLLPVAAAGVGLRLTGVRQHGPLLAVVKGSAALMAIGITGGAGVLGYRHLFAKAGETPPSLAPPLAGAGDVPSDFSTLRNALASNMAAVVADENGHLRVQSLGDRLRTLHQIHGDTRVFIAAARALLQENGLRQQLDDLLPSSVQPTQLASADIAPRKAHSRHTRSALEPSAVTAGELEVLNSLIAPPPDALAQNEHLYFTAWRDSLPRGEALAWLRYAPEDRQIAFKKLLDHVATRELALLSDSQTVLAEQPGATQLTGRLRLQHLPGRPEEIRLNATLSESAGSLSAPVTVSLTLDEAWQTGMLDNMLASDSLSVEVLSQRRLLKADALAAFKTGLRGIAAPPDVATLNQDHRVRLAFRHLTEARFELSTLEAELKGELRSNDHIRGLRIVEKFRSGSADVEAGQLTFSAKDASGRPFSTPLSGWLVLRDNDASYADPPYVLYDADAIRSSHYFSGEQAMMQFLNERFLRDPANLGRLETTATAEGKVQTRHLSEFFHDLAQNYNVWTRRNAMLSFTPEPGATFDASMSAFAARVQDRNTFQLGYSVATRDAAARVVKLGANWARARSQQGLPTLLEYTREWMQTQEQFGAFLQSNQVIDSAEDFDPDAFVIRSPSGKNNGTLTEFAAYLRRAESGSADFVRNMEILPAAVIGNAYVNALSRTGKTTFADTLGRAVSTPSGAKPRTADERYIATLGRDGVQVLHAAMQMYVKLNQPAIREGIDSALKTSYPGTDYQHELRGKLDFAQPQNRALRNAWNMLAVSKMQFALATAQQSGTQAAAGGPPAGDLRRIQTLLAGFPASTRSGHDFVSPLTAGGVRVPGMVMFSLRDGLRLANGERVSPRQYVYSPETIDGEHLFAASEFSALLKRSQVAQDVVTARAALADTAELKRTIESTMNRGSSEGVPVGYALVDGYDPYIEMIEGKIADADTQTISRWEVAREATMSGVVAAMLPACLMSGPAAAAACAALTVTSLIDDGYEAIQQWSRNERGMALVTGLLGTLDVTDISKGAKSVGRAVGAGRALNYVRKQAPAALAGVAGGAQGMLSRLGLKAFGSVADAAGSTADAHRHSSAFEMGWLKRDWAISVDLGSAQRVTPRGALAGNFHELNGKTYITERGYPGEAPLVYEVKVENGGAVRVVNPAHPDVPAEKIRWSDRKWVKDSQGLLGGGHYSDLQLQAELKKMKKTFEKEAESELACDTKSQRVLKVMQRNKLLWNDIQDKVEVRVIKVRDGAVNKEIVLHPKDEDAARWSGSYHVYITVNINDRRMVVDPYVGGPDSCASVSEDDFIKHHWLGVEGEDYEVRNLAPYTETYKGGDPDDLDDLVTYSVEDFRDSHETYDPSYYPSHEFYYRS